MPGQVMEMQQMKSPFPGMDPYLEAVAGETCMRRLLFTPEPCSIDKSERTSGRG